MQVLLPWLASAPIGPLGTRPNELLATMPIGRLASFHADLGPRQVVSGTFALAILLLGAAITLIAFQGYRRNRSRPMLFLAVGFGLIIFGNVVAVALVLLLGLEGDEFAFRTAIQLSQVAGLLSILYALRVES